MKQNYFSKNISIISLLIANLTPIIGVLFYGWDLLNILVIYWFEGIIVLFYTILKIIKIESIKVLLQGKFYFSIYLYLGVLFVYLVIIVFALMPLEKGLPFVFNALWETLIIGKWTIILLFISHGISFFYNFTKNEEYANLSIDDISRIPFERFGFVQTFVVSTSIFSLFFISPRQILLATLFSTLFIIIMKIVFDIYTHANEHNLLFLKKRN